MGHEPVGLLVIRARVEEGSDSPLRVTIRLTLDTTTGFTEELTSTDADEVATIVRNWLRHVVDSVTPR